MWHVLEVSLSRRDRWIRPAERYCPSSDRLWNALIADAVNPASAAGKDKFGQSWQIVSPILNKLLTDPDPGRATRVMRPCYK